MIVGLLFIGSVWRLNIAGCLLGLEFDQGKKFVQNIVGLIPGYTSFIYEDSTLHILEESNHKNLFDILAERKSRIIPRRPVYVLPSKVQIHFKD
jgi:hypothetical protein